MDKERLEELKDDISYLLQIEPNYAGMYRQGIYDDKKIEEKRMEIVSGIIALIDAALTEPSDADVAEAIKYFGEVLPYMAECEGEEHYIIAIAALRQMGSTEPCEWCKYYNAGEMISEKLVNGYETELLQDVKFCPSCGRPLEGGE